MVWRVARSALALVSVIVLGVTGYAYAKEASADSGLTKENVISGQSAGGVMNILLVGMDSRTDAKGNPLPAAELDALHAGPDDGEIDTDTLILIHIPAGGGQAVGLSIPRDSWVNIPGYGYNKINSAFGFAKNKQTLADQKAGGMSQQQIELDSNQAGAKETIQTVENLTGVTIDHYASINLEGFAEISNAIGGVEVCLLHAVNDPYSGADFNAGYFSVQGIQALEFVRQRHNIPGGSTDIEREQRQQVFLAGAAHKILSGGVLTSPSKLDALVNAVQGALTIDSGWDLLSFAQEMSQMTSGNIKFESVPTVNIDYTPPNSGGASAVEVNPAQIQAFIQAIDNPGGSTSSSAPSNAAAASTPQNTPAASGNSAITVYVRNATKTTNLAADVLGVLGSAGFTKGDSGTSTTKLSKSIIYFPSGQESNAQTVASALGGNFTLEESSSLTSGQVSVYLGSNYNGPTTASGSSGTSTGTSGASGLMASGGSTTAPTTSAAVPTGSTAPLSQAGDKPPCIN